MLSQAQNCSNVNNRGTSRKSQFNSERALLITICLLLSQNLSRQTSAAATTMDYDIREKNHERERVHSNRADASNAAEIYDLSVNDSNDMDREYVEAYENPRINLPTYKISREQTIESYSRNSINNNNNTNNFNNRGRAEIDLTMNADNFSQQMVTIVNTELPPTKATTTTTADQIRTSFSMQADSPKTDSLMPTKTSSEDYEGNNSKVDYEENENMNGSLYQQSQQKDDAMLVAMKFYQAAEVKAAENPWQNLQQLPEAMPLLQQKIRPGQQLETQFPNNSEDSGYYVDSLEESLEHFGKEDHTMDQTETPMIELPDYTTTAAAAAAPAAAAPAAAAPAAAATTVNNTVVDITATTTTSVTVNVTNMSTTDAPTEGPLPPTRPTPLYPGTGYKQAKQIIISQRKLLPYEQLRDYVEDAYIRMPLAVIVDPSAESLQKTKALWNDAMRADLNIKIVLVALNASGSPAAYNFNNTRQFLGALNSIKENAGGDSFIGIVHASDLVPYDSAVFISTTAMPPHTELVQDAAITLLKKRIRLYVIWFGERSISENEAQEAIGGGLLGEVALRSGGEVLHIVDSERSPEFESNRNTFVADVFRRSQLADVSQSVATTLSTGPVTNDAPPSRSITLDAANGG